MQFSFLRKDLFWQKSLEPCVRKFAISHKLRQFYCCQLVVSQLKKFPKNLKSPKIIVFGCTRFFGNVCCLFNCLKAFLYFFILLLLSFYTISFLFSQVALVVGRTSVQRGEAVEIANFSQFPPPFSMHASLIFLLKCFHIFSRRLKSFFWED